MAFAIKPLTARPMGASLAGMLEEKTRTRGEGRLSSNVVLPSCFLSGRELACLLAAHAPFPSAASRHANFDRPSSPPLRGDRRPRSALAEKSARARLPFAPELAKNEEFSFSLSHSSSSLTLKLLCFSQLSSTPPSTARRAIAARPAARRAGVVVA